MPDNSTSFVMTNIKGKIKKNLGNLYGLRTWVEYGFRQCKQELGWTDYRFTNFHDRGMFPEEAIVEIENEAE
jgi:SRSO17 transposase